MAEPSAEIYAHWNSKDGFYSVYDPSPYIAPVENPIKIYVDQGHNFAGYHNSGAQGNGLDEGAVTYEIGIRLAVLLENDPRFEVRLSRPTKSTVLGTDNSSSLRARSSGANSWGADYFVSIHCNSASAASAHGTEVYSYDAPSDGSRLAGCILNSLCSATGLSSRGTKVNPELAVLRQTAMAAVLVETGFVSNASDAALLSSNPGLFAQGIYNGIVAFCFG
ncbi:MAG: N-acetylmuramoyl-L-alanine amidase [Clostridia bacterium]|nr:N-acetylmuramoyl-L-alanine amidase [Clostridia bacterium]